MQSYHWVRWQEVGTGNCLKEELCSKSGIGGFAFFALLQFIGTAHASALTTAIGANERLCFYADVDKAGEKIGVGGLAVSRRTSDLPKRASQFYFAVSILLGR